jgi:hypothetical protein
VSVTRIQTHRSKARLALFALGIVLASANVAFADEYDATFTRAIAAKERALDLNDPAAFEQALELFQQADRIRATKESKYELGSVASRLRQDDLAVEAYEASLALGLEGTAADKARAFVQEKQGEMGRIAVTGPAGAELYVGARRRASLPLERPLVVFAGKVRLRAVLGGREVRREVAVAQSQDGSLDLGPDFAAQPVASTPVPTYTPPIFTHPPPPDETPPRSGPDAADVLTIGGASVAVISLGTLILAYTQLSTHRDRLKEVCAVPRGEDECDKANTGERAAAQDEVDSIATYKTLRTASYVGLGAGLVLGGIGVALLSSRQNEPRSSAFIAPTPGGFAIGFGGSLPTW